jgi:signal transduction histidine kinase
VEKGEYLNILENVRDGLFLLDSNRNIAPYYSASLETIFRRGDLAGCDITEIFSAFLDEKTRANAAEFFDVSFDPNIPWRHVEKLNPLAETDAYFDDRAGGFIVRRLEFSFARIGGDGKVDRLFAVVRDLTEQKELADEVEKTRNESRQEMEMLQRIIHVEPPMLMDFLEGVKDDAEAINDELRSGGENYGDRLDAIFRHSHAIKGDSQLISLDFLSDKAEGLEQRIVELRKKTNIEAGDFLPLTISCSDLMNSIEKLEGIINKWLKLSDTVRGSVIQKGDGLGAALGGMAKRLAERYGKEIELTSSGFENYNLHPGKSKALRDILVQFVRNSVYHGIEKPADREAAGKKRAGQIRISARSDESKFYILYRDDGAGIDGEKAASRAVSRGLITREKAKGLSEQEKIRFIFQPGFSTAENGDAVAGKGVGLSLVRQRIKQLNGKLTLKSRPGLYCEFSLVFPLLEFMMDE